MLLHVQAVEFWSTLCDIEMELMEDESPAEVKQAQRDMSAALIRRIQPPFGCDTAVVTCTAAKWLGVGKPAPPHNSLHRRSIVSLSSPVLLPATAGQPQLHQGSGATPGASAVAAADQAGGGPGAG